MTRAAEARLKLFTSSLSSTGLFSAFKGMCCGQRDPQPIPELSHE
jgi:hypothetical protein